MGTVTLLENLRAVFYAPFYVAVARDYFGDHGVEVQFLESTDPGDTLPRLVSGEVDLCWGGPLRVLRAHDQDPDCGLVCFNEVVGRDPFFVVGRAFGDPFSLAALKRRRLGVVTEVPTPWICLRQDLRDLSVDVAEIGVVEGASMAENEAAMLAGDLDAFQAFQPFAERAVQAGGDILYAAATRGPTAYTSFYTTRQLAAARREDFTAMSGACQRAVRAVREEGGAGVAPVLERYFPDVGHDVLAAAIDRYVSLDLYNPTGELSRAGFARLRESMLGAGFIARGADYDTCVDNTLLG